MPERLMTHKQEETVARYRRKPTEVDAYQITLEMLDGILFDEQPYPKGLRVSSCSTYPPERRINNWRGTVVTIHGQDTKVIVGDWIVTEPDGVHHYPIKPDIFKDTYGAVEDKENMMTDKEVLHRLNDMCAESLSPEVHDMWDLVKLNLANTRKSSSLIDGMIDIDSAECHCVMDDSDCCGVFNVIICGETVCNECGLTLQNAKATVGEES